MTSLIADRRLYETAAKDAIVEEGDVRSRWLIAGVGSTIGASDVQKYGLTMKGGRVRYAGSPELEDLPEVKAATKHEDKAATEHHDKPATADEEKVIRFGGVDSDRNNEPEGDDGIVGELAGSDLVEGDGTGESLPPVDEDGDTPEERESPPPPPEWTQRTTPEAYLRVYPTGPNAKLARDVIAARSGADGGS